ncbi:conserved hypothetical protein [Nitrospira defluvii]|uniref:Uncharacterized protein n=1 Tax=Nitrospira defluvii TaxID=330214 RepID=A0ABM8QW31_9BACT|nr:conserved hypothetical protein [Nitrospira defluvii]
MRAAIYKLVRTEVEPEICAWSAESVRKQGESVSKALGAVKSRYAEHARPDWREAPCTPLRVVQTRE